MEDVGISSLHHKTWGFVVVVVVCSQTSMVESCRIKRSQNGHWRGTKNQEEESPIKSWVFWYIFRTPKRTQVLAKESRAES